MRAEFLQQIDRERLPRMAAERWNAAGNIEHVQDSESFVYRIKNGSDIRFLRLTHDRHRIRGQIEAELHFIKHLASQGVAVAAAMPAADGSAIQSLQLGEWNFHACLFSAAGGKRFSFRSIGDDEETLRRWGRLLGTIHAAAAVFRPTVRRYRWNEDDVWHRAESYLPETEIKARLELVAIRGWLVQQQENTNNFGLVHGDLCMANFHVERDILTAFDFDDSCYHWFIYDIVCALAPNIGLPENVRRAIRHAFIEGYKTAHPLPADWEIAFDQFLRMRGLYLFILNHRNWNGEMADHPKRGFLDLLRASFERPIQW